MKRLFLAAAMILIVLPQALLAQGGSCYDCFDQGTYSTCLYLQTTGYDDCSQQTATSCNLRHPCGGGGGGCFLAGTKVSTPNGQRSIESIRVGDLVLARDSMGRVVSRPVTRTYRSLVRSYLRVNGSLQVTADHPFLASGQWLKSSELVVGTRLKLLNGGSIDVVSVEEIRRGARVFNIEVGEDHTFYANGILVHNKNPDRQG